MDQRTAERMEFWGRVCGIVGGALMGLSTFLSTVAERTLLKAEKQAVQEQPKVSYPHQEVPSQKSSYPSGAVYGPMPRTGYGGGGISDDKEFY